LAYVRAAFYFKEVEKFERDESETAFFLVDRQFIVSR